jgi:hypothetical protein
MITSPTPSCPGFWSGSCGRSRAFSVHRQRAILGNFGTARIRWSRLGVTIAIMPGAPGPASTPGPAGLAVLVQRMLTGVAMARHAPRVCDGGPGGEMIGMQMG